MLRQGATMLAVAVTVFGCRTEMARNPADQEDPVQRGGSATETSLPRMLTLEIKADDTLALDGSNVTLEQLPRSLEQLAAGQRFVDVVVWVEAGASRATSEAVLDQFLNLKLTHFRYAMRGTEGSRVALRAGEGRPREQGEPAVPLSAHATTPALPGAGPALVETGERQPAAGEARAAVNARSVGLHIGGGPNDDDTRKPLLEVFERQLPAFKDCYAGATPTAEPASFGVDLLLEANGGKAVVRDVRTRLGPESFKSCMLSTLTTIQFPPLLTKRAVVSYSVLFEPAK